MNIWIILAACAVMAIITFILRQGLLSFCFGACAIVGASIVLCESIGAKFEEAIIVATLVFVIWSAVFMYLYDMFE